jgi:hypothetical protein
MSESKGEKVTVRYRTISFKVARAKNYPAPYGEDWEYIGDYEDYATHGIWRFEDGVPVKCLGTDGGEPEDNSFVRDGAWIAPALDDAFLLGCKYGYEVAMQDAAHDIGG